ncbi:hypothetical protein LOTGIDRAFT_162240 [Lottia gigantea]|uniref:Major facilitator superfamily (MFS) profile domain-containing protein n=1 Tax=Lottia gigantea TaxID=225164 RepID=V4BUJ5_LOTGI|nr:hypothetical protein LOTGIDRAFT_162240 [Lottia gigantea]ESO92759.1 hypothetical protein LOTGIDRAFT_162240 [Lottia gigantea]
MAKPNFIFEFPRKDHSKSKVSKNGDASDSLKKDVKSEIRISYNDSGKAVEHTKDVEEKCIQNTTEEDELSNNSSIKDDAEGESAQNNLQNDSVDEQMVIEQAFSQITHDYRSDEVIEEEVPRNDKGQSQLTHTRPQEPNNSTDSDSIHGNEESFQKEISIYDSNPPIEKFVEDEDTSILQQSHSPDNSQGAKNEEMPESDQLQTKDDSCQTDQAMDFAETGHINHERKELNTYTGTEPSTFLESLTDVHHKVITLEIEAPHHSAVDGVDNLAFQDDTSTVSGDVKRRKSVGFLESGDESDTLGYDEEKKISKRRKSIRYSIYDILQRPNESSSRKKIGRFLVTVAAAINMYFNMGICFSLGTFLPSWLEEFQETRSKTALIQSFTIGMIFGSGIIVGVLVDRYGVRLATFCGSVMASIGLLGAVFCPNTVSLMVSLGFLTGLGSSFVQLGSGVTISLTYKNSASVGLGLITAGGGLGGSTMPYIMKSLIEYYGWRGAFFILSGLALQTVVSSLLMTSFMEQAVGGRRAAKREPIAWKTKIKTICRPKFVLNILATMTGFGAMNGFVFIIFDYADKNDGNGVFYLFLATVLSTASRLAFGVINMFSFVNSSALMAIAVIGGGASILLLSISESYAFTLFLICIFGICYGGLIGIYGVVVLDLVGRETFALAIGLGSTFNGTASTLGGYFFGLLYDITKTYSRALVIMGSIPVVAGLVPITIVLNDVIYRLVSGIMRKSSP